MRVPQIQLGRVGGFGVKTAVDGGDGAGDFFAEGGLQGLGKTRVGGGELGGVGEDGGHVVSFVLGWMERQPEKWVWAGLGVSERVVGWVAKPNKYR